MPHAQLQYHYSSLVWDQHRVQAARLCYNTAFVYAVLVSSTYPFPCWYCTYLHLPCLSFSHISLPVQSFPTSTWVSVQVRLNCNLVYIRWCLRGACLLYFCPEWYVVPNCQSDAAAYKYDEKAYKQFEIVLGRMTRSFSFISQRRDSLLSACSSCILTGPFAACFRLCKERDHVTRLHRVLWVIFLSSSVFAHFYTLVSSPAYLMFGILLLSTSLPEFGIHSTSGFISFIPRIIAYRSFIFLLFSFLSFSFGLYSSTRLTF